MEFNRHPKKLILGAEYRICFWYHSAEIIIAKFIQPTEKGFNFLNLDTNKCILKHHLYPSKYLNRIKNDENWFFVSDFLIIKDDIRGNLKENRA